MKTKSLKKSSKTKVKLPAVLLGSGVLNWPRTERVGDRYGIVYLAPKSGGYFFPGEKDPQEPAVKFQNIECTHEGEHGVLTAVVLDTHKSGHIGDLFHGIFPRTPKIGQRIGLGTGTLFHETSENMNGFGAGLKPDDGRRTQWLSIRALYDCHDQTVELWFSPD